jgi:hypothetical protein
MKAESPRILEVKHSHRRAWNHSLPTVENTLLTPIRSKKKKYNLDQNFPYFQKVIIAKLIVGSA